jgi:transposase-like protein
MVERMQSTESFRRMVAKAYYTSNKSIVQIGKEFKVNRGTVFHWVKHYKSEFQPEDKLQREILTFGSVINKEVPMKKKTLNPEQMEQRILELEAQLKQEQMRSIVLSQMIDTAEQELKVPIRKKSGAKQSK